MARDSCPVKTLKLEGKVAVAPAAAPPLMPSSTSRNPRVVSYPSQPVQLHVGTRSQLTQYVGAGELSTIEVLVASSTPQQGEEANPVQFAASNFASACPDYTSCGQLALAVVNRKRKRVSGFRVRMRSHTGRRRAS